MIGLAHPLPSWPAQTVVPAKRGRTPLDWLPTPELIRQLPRLLELATVPGLAIAVVERGRIWERGFGRARTDPSRLMADDTVFEAASLGKPLFAYEVLRLVDAGALELDRPLYDYLPTPEADNARMRRVTARHVLSHTTGLPNWRKEPGPLEPMTEPGTVYVYSGEGFFYLQRVVEKVTGLPVARLMETEVFRPLGMTESSYVWRPAYDRRMAVGYDEDGRPEEVYAAIGRRGAIIAEQWGRPVLEWRYADAARVVPLINAEWPVVPLYMVPNVACSLLTTASDYAKFLLRLVARPPAGLPLRPATLEAMTRPQVEINSALSWGLGWGIQHDEFGQVLWHWGANNSFRNFVVADMANGRAVVVLTNGENGPRVYERVIASLTGHDHPAFLRA
ncbi:MAG: serine hydrolase domain-containing protein [Gemmatimonadales bacterium]